MPSAVQVSEKSLQCECLENTGLLVTWFKIWSVESRIFHKHPFSSKGFNSLRRLRQDMALSPFPLCAASVLYSTLPSPVHFHFCLQCMLGKPSEASTWVLEIMTFSPLTLEGSFVMSCHDLMLQCNPLLLIL